MKETKYALELRNISKSFGSLVANDAIDLKIKQGTVHALIGENGAGKSTLMNIVTNLYQPDSGELFIHGKKVVYKDTRDSSRHGIGMVYQEFMLFENLTVLENIIMGCEQIKHGIFLDKKSCRNKIEEICQKYQFHIPLNVKVKTLPVAQLQQVEIVKILFRGADILILDEPTSVLTPQGIEGLFEAIRFLKTIGKTIVIITHKLKEVFAIADEITVLKSGRVTGTVLPSEVTEEQLANLMVGRDVILQVHKQINKGKEPVLEIHNLTVKDNLGICRLKNLNITVRSKEIIGIAGVAGSGQQQLSEAIVGLRTPEKGSEICIHGQSVINKNIRERKCLGLGYIPQDRLAEGVNAAGTIWENAIMGYQIVRGFCHRWILDKKEAIRFTNSIIERYSIKAGNVEERVSSLSGGNIQKLVVGREISMQSSLENCLLIVEDPTRGIDVGAIEFIWDKILDIAFQGAAILLISHELNEVMQLSDHIYVMYNGRLKDGGGYGELQEKEIGLLMTGGGEQDETRT